MIDAAKESGAEIVKFQMRQMETIYGFDKSSKDLGLIYFRFTFKESTF